MLRLLASGLASLLIYGALHAPASAAEPLPAAYEPGDIVLSVEGGDPGESIARALSSFLDSGATLVTEPHVVRRGDSPCKILVQRGYPPSCKPMLKVLDRLNPGLNPSRGRLALNDTLLLPKVDLSTYRTGRVFTPTMPDAATQASSLIKEWKGLNNPKQKLTPRGLLVEYDAYEVRIPTQKENEQRQAIERLEPLGSRNLLIDAVAHTPGEVGLYQRITAAVYQASCADGTAFSKTVDYKDYAASDGDLKAIVDAMPVVAEPRVFVLDVPVKRSPNLFGAFEGDATLPPGGNLSCAWASKVAGENHATHMAGIVASRRAGFVGLSPETKLGTFNLLEPAANQIRGVMPAGRDLELATLVDRQSRTGSRDVYLIASTFKALDPTAPPLSNPAARFTARLERKIMELDPLFIVAAGHADAGQAPVALSPSSPHSPLNLGDLANVVVVSACKDCTRKSTGLLPEANYGYDGRFVHIAAPGGEELPGWVEPGFVGAASGTSQAAAYVAGVAASMIARYPTEYGQAAAVKLRLQATSWPIYRRRGMIDGDNKKLVTGVVDPLMALLDPKKTWVKESTGWREVQVKSLPASAVALQGVDGTTTYVKLDNLLRLVRVESATPETPVPIWVAYYDRYGAEEEGATLREVARRGPLQALDVELAVCKGPPVRLAQVLDLVAPNAGLEAKPCAR